MKPNIFTSVLLHTFAENYKMLNFYDYIIIGAGIAGISAAETILKYDNTGEILLINNEDRLPYKRTSISKRLAAGFQKEELALKPADWFNDFQINLVNGKVNEIDPFSKSILLNSKTIYWNKLIICTGSKATEIYSTFDQANGLLYFRNAADADFIREHNIVNEHIVIVGGGVQGIELAEQMHVLGNKVSLIHHEQYLMNKHFDRFMSSHLLEILQNKRIDINLKSKIKSIQKSDNQQFIIEFENSQSLFCDKIIVNIGTKPDLEIALAAGLHTNKGILVNKSLQTSHPDIYAAGDVSEHENGLVTGLWHAAEKQGMIAGANAAGQQFTFEKINFRLKLNAFDQYYFSMNPQINNPDFESVVVNKENKYYRFFFKNNTLHGLLMINDKDNAKQLEQAVREEKSKVEILNKYG